jgi:hypothetical protein
VATLLIFWLASVYTEFIAHGLHEARLHLRAVPTAISREVSMLAAPALSILFLLLAALDLLAAELAVRLALWNGVLQLFGWGVELGRRSGRSWPTALLTGVVNGALGVVVVAAPPPVGPRPVSAA